MGDVTDERPFFFFWKKVWKLVSITKVSPIFVNTTSEKVNFLNQVKGKVPIIWTIYPKNINKNYLYYQCSVDGPGLQFLKSINIDERY